MCGAPAASESTRCEHCRAPLATIACPQCFGMMFVGAKYCSHCGAKADRREKADAVLEVCPRCRVNTQAVILGQTELRECPRCEGIWADTESLQEICTDRERQAAVLGVAAAVSPAEGRSLEKITYLPCPVCRQLMHRVNFARCSNVIVDVCKPHGTWFDKDELRRIVEFIQAGGFDKARAHEIAELERKRCHLEAVRTAAAREKGLAYETPPYGPRQDALSLAAAAVLSAFFD